MYSSGSWPELAHGLEWTEPCTEVDHGKWTGMDQ